MPQAFITTSWDDGHPCDMRLADLLARHGLTGTFYIPRSIPSGVMPISDIRALSSNFEIGAHTLNHVFLPDTDDVTARTEIAGSKSWIEDVTGQACPMFCPPGGRFKSRHVKMFRDAGYTGIRTVEFFSLDLPRLHDGLLEMPTTLQVFPQPALNYWKNLIKRRAVTNFWLYARHGRSGNWAVLARRLLQRTLRVGGVFHLWGHSWELDQAALWSRLEDVLKLLAEVRDQAPCLTNGQLCQLHQQQRVLTGKSTTSTATTTTTSTTTTSVEVRDPAHDRLGERSPSASESAQGALPPRRLLRD